MRMHHTFENLIFTLTMLKRLAILTSEIIDTPHVLLSVHVVVMYFQQCPHLVDMYLVNNKQLKIRPNHNNNNQTKKQLNPKSSGTKEAFCTATAQ